MSSLMDIRRRMIMDGMPDYLRLPSATLLASDGRVIMNQVYKHDTEQTEPETEPIEE